MAVSLQQNALLDLQTVKDELALTDTSQDAFLTRRINVVSDAIEAFCKRKFPLASITENEAVPQTTPPRITLSRTPVLVVASVTEEAIPGPGSLVDPSEYDLENAKAGIVYRVSRWRNSAIRRPDIVQDFDPGTEKEDLQVVYLGGYVTLPQALAAGAWPGASVAVSIGTLLTSGGNLWVCTTAGTTGTSQPTFSSTPTAASLGQNGLTGGTTVTEGPTGSQVTWTALGSVGAAGQRGTAVSLPSDLENAALETVVMHYRRRGANTEIKSESMLGASATYGDRTDFPPSALATLRRYIRRGVA